MVTDKVLFFVNEVSSTSIPVELAAKINNTTKYRVSIASFYDNSLNNVDSDVADMNINIYPLNASNRFDINAYQRLRSLLFDFDILHTHHNSVGSLGRIAAQGTGIKIVNTEHNDHRFFTHLQNLSNCPTYPLADMMITNSESTQKSFRLYERPFVSLTDCKTIYNGIDIERIESGLNNKKLPKLPEGDKIVTAATISKQKNLTTLVEAMEEVLEVLPESKLVIIGDGPLRPYIEKRTKELSIEHSTTFVGYLPEREQVYGTIAKCDIFAVPSLYEGFCNAAVESMRCGLPVVASDIEVLREVVGEGGRFADPQSPSEFASKLQTLLQDDIERKSLGNIAKKRAEDQFSIRRTVDNYINIYETVLDK